MHRRTRRSRAAMMVTVPVVLAVGGFWAVEAARGAGDSVVVTAAAAGSTASPAATPEEIGPDGWPKSMRTCLKASGFEMKSVEGGTVVVTRDEDTQKLLSPERPTVAWRQDRVAFWDAIGRGLPADRVRPRASR